MKLVVLSPADWSALNRRLNVPQPDEEPADAFWHQAEQNEAALRQFYAHFGEEEKDWEVPTLWNRCAVIYSYLYTEALYTPELLPGLAALIPHDGRPWYAELECYTDIQRTATGRPLCLGYLVLHEGHAYTSTEYTELIARAAKLQLELDA